MTEIRSSFYIPKSCRIIHKFVYLCGMGGLRNILIGWGTWLGALELTKEAKEESERRLKICDGCPFAKHSIALEILNNTDVRDVETKYCTVCKCPCHQKSIANKFNKNIKEEEFCPENKW